jgi:putative acetyltransferase
MPLTPVVAEFATADLPEVRAMLREYATWLGIDLSYQDFAFELESLPGRYVPPTGALYVARLGDDVVGMVAFRQRDAATAEMKRLFVRPAARGARIGHLLVERIIAAAREARYQTMVLDTLPVMGSAQRMYESFGFEDISPYYESPVPGTRYMALRLVGMM